MTTTRTMITATVSSTLQRRLTEVGRRIGNTPLLSFSGLLDNPRVQLYAKLEWQQLTGSVKARAGYNIIRQAILSGELGEGRHLLDATSGNTGIAYAAVGAALGVPVTLCLPENASRERKQKLKALGAEIIFTSRFESTDGAQRQAKALVAEQPDKYFYADQYNNENNWKAHYYGTAEEIWRQTEGRITHFVAGLGTTGTFVGNSRRLRELNPEIRTVALHPNNPMHGLEGWKHLETAIVPGIYDQSTADEHLPVDTEEAFGLVKHIARREGLLISPSAAANLAGALQVARRLKQGVIVTTLADDASKYSEVLDYLYP